jgi:predicted KAP-like P-loop ATPase
VLAAIINLMPKNSKFKKLLQHSLGFLKYSAKNLLILGLEKTLGKATIDMVKKTAKETKKNMHQSNTSIAKERLNDHLNANSSLKLLQDALAGITKEKKLIIFIDELDRCKPDFALHMLEIIKHVFDVDGIKFVLVTNVYQLEASIKHRYGIDINADEYLGKFRKYKFTLNRLIDNNTDVSKKYFISLVGKKYDSLLDNDLLNFIEHIIKSHNLSLRQIEDLDLCIDLYSLLENTKFNEKTIYGYKLLRLFAIILYCINHRIIENIAKDTADAEEIANFLGVGKINYSDEYMKTNEVILVLIASECRINSKSYAPVNQDEKNSRKKVITDYFSNFFRNTDEKNFSNIIIKVYNTLNFNAQG